ncbi:hypothetical protein [Nocardioides abyssi]|uniref:Uncharacterized protein n=1 Tax=Nocardioides abyssi TaxID=3058370 RepID=A0ABT8ESK9_9ACTN|nr:hypothetical protein [Nocardioides abyssi]MDN4161104.1 hypothetical protein [Nocardioides abyssi]
MLTPGGQFRVEMPSGRIVERLPVGHANGHWHLTFVTSGQNPVLGDRARGVTMRDEFQELIDVAGVDGELEVRGRGCGGDADEQTYTLRLFGSDVTEGRIEYRDEGAVVASEVIDLTAAEMT